VLEVIAGADARDPTCAAVGVPDLAAACTESIAGLAVGVPTEYFPDHLDPAIRAACDRALEHLRACGAQVRSVSLPSTHSALAAYYVLAPAEAASNLARFDGVCFGVRAAGAATVGDMDVRSRTEGFGDEVRRRLMLGTYVLSRERRADYFERAQRARRRIAAEFTAVFAEVDVLLTPATPTTAFRLGEKTEPAQMYAADVFTVAASLAGV